MCSWRSLRAAASGLSGHHAQSSRRTQIPCGSRNRPCSSITTQAWRVIEELRKLALVALKQVHGAAGAGDGADQIGAGFALKALEGVLLAIREELQLNKD